jgi:uncharacterized protein (DUF983 family)
MTFNNIDNFHDKAASPVLPAERPVMRAMLRGAAGTCPACGNAALFCRFVDVHEACSSCNLPLYHHRADDLPAYLNILLVGHIVVGLMVAVMLLDLFSMWTLMGITVVLSVISAIALMRPLKGIVIGAQWALCMHGFDKDTQNQ